MFLYDLSHTPGRSLYDKLTDCIRRDILAGTLTAGTRLPSKRSAADALGVSVVTVQAAYEQLLAEGYLRAVERRGYFVAVLERGNDLLRPAGKTPPAPKETIPPAGSGREGRLPVRAGSRPDKAENTPACDIDVSVNSVSPELFPLSVWNRLTRRVYADEGQRLLCRVPYNGLPSLRAAIAEALLESRGIRTSPDCILVSAGNEMLYSTLLSFLGRGRVFGVEDPGYPLISRLYRQNGAAVRPLPMDAQGVIPAALEESGADVLHISPSHHFPTGIVTPIGRRQELLAWLERDPRRVIIEDDYDSEFRLSGRPIPSLQRLDVTGRVIYINTFTKTIAPSLRIAYAVLPPEMAADYGARFGYLSCPVAVPEQYVLAAFMQEGSLSRHINRMRTHYRTLRDSLLARLSASPRAGRYAVSEADGGLHFLLRVDTDLSDDALTAAAAALGVRVRSLGDYRLPPDPPLPECPPRTDTHTLVISYAGLSEVQAAEFVSRLDKIG